MEQAYEIASMPMGNMQLTHKQDHPHLAKYHGNICQHTWLYVFDLARAALKISKQKYCYRTKSSTAYTEVEKNPGKAKSSGKLGSIP